MYILQTIIDGGKMRKSKQLVKIISSLLLFLLITSVSITPKNIESINTSKVGYAVYVAYLEFLGPD